MTRRIVFIHGAWVTPLCWEPFQFYFEEHGYLTSAPPWPGKHDAVEAQRAAPSPTLKGLGIKEIVDHYERILRDQPEPPYLIGHSFGGLFVQILLDRGFGAAGVAIDSAPPKGVFAFYPSAFRSLFKVLTAWRGWQRVLHMALPEFRYAFVNNMPAEEQRAVYDRYVVPETGRIFFQAALAPLSPNSVARVDFLKATRPPLLLIAGGSDHIVPATINRSNYRRQRQGPGMTAFKEFSGRTRWIIAQQGWQEVAEYIRGWLESVPQDRPGSAR